MVGLCCIGEAVLIRYQGIAVTTERRREGERKREGGLARALSRIMRRRLIREKCKNKNP